MLKIDSRLLAGFVKAIPTYEESGHRDALEQIALVDGEMVVSNGHYVFASKIQSDFIGAFKLIPKKIPTGALISEFDFESLTATHYNKKGDVVGVNVIKIFAFEFPCFEHLKQVKTKPTAGIGFNADYLSMPHKLFGAKCVNMSFGGEEECCKISFRCKSGTDVTLYVMPLRK